MQQLAILLYVTCSVVYWLLAIFIVYHIRKYMLDKKLATTLSMLFLVGMVVFFVVNLMFFLVIPFDGVGSSGVWNGR